MGRAAAKPDRIIPVNEEIPISPGTQAARRKIPMMQSAIICIPSSRRQSLSQSLQLVKPLGASRVAARIRPLAPGWA